MKKFLVHLLDVLVLVLFVGLCIFGYRNNKDVKLYKEQKLVPFEGTSDYFRISQTGNVETSCDVITILAEMLEKDSESIKSDEYIDLTLLRHTRTRSLVLCKQDTSIFVERIDGTIIFYSPKKGLRYRESDFKEYTKNEILILFNNEIKRWGQYFNSPD